MLKALQRIGVLFVEYPMGTAWVLGIQRDWPMFLGGPACTFRFMYVAVHVAKQLSCAVLMLESTWLTAEHHQCRYCLMYLYMYISW